MIISYLNDKEGFLMKRRQMKKHVLTILDQHNIDIIHTELSEFPLKDLVNPLFTALCSTSEVVRWNAVVVFGKVVPGIAQDNMESARVIMRRFLWTLNDESGGIGWGSPEAMAEIMAMHNGLADEYLHMLISYTREDGPELFQDGNYLELPMLQRGVLWGIGRLCHVKPEMMRERGIEDDISNYLGSEDGVVRGLAVWCLTALKSTKAMSKVLELSGNNDEIPLFVDGTLHTFTTGQLVQRYNEAVAQGVDSNAV